MTYYNVISRLVQFAKKIHYQITDPKCLVQLSMVIMHGDHQSQNQSIYNFNSIHPLFSINPSQILKFGIDYNYLSSMLMI